ncbi:MAG: hypothetical protein IJR70_05855 [Eubacterium sp.]|nr:hypothetical protein [Eubacterium sp.]
MNTMEEFVRLMHDQPEQAFDYLSNNAYQFRASELVSITKELLYAAYDMLGKDDHDKVIKTAAENMADNLEIDLYDDVIIPEQSNGRN